MSDLLNQASLVMIPSGYKEDVVYSEIPTDGSGDMIFSRASDGTRINSAGLVENCPWNLVQYSEQFDNAYWNKYISAVTANATTAPNGTTTADKLEYTSSSLVAVLYTASTAIANQVYTLSCYAKKGNTNILQIGFTLGSGDKIANYNLNTGVITTTSSGVTATIESVGNGWYRCIMSLTTDINTPNVFINSVNGASGEYIYIWGAQLNIGSTAKPYFPTTNRQDVPRLTYQNGGGGCPSLLLEKQSTNISSYSESSNSFAAAIVTNAPNLLGMKAYNVKADYSLGDAPNIPCSDFLANNTYTSSMYVDFDSLNGTEFITTILAFFPSVEYAVMVVNKATKAITSSTTGGGVWTINQAKIEHQKDEIYRIILTATTNAYGQAARTYCNAGQLKSINVAGIQVEVSNYPTSYIQKPTSASATRLADACYKTGISSLIGQTSGSVFFDFTVDSVTQTGDPVLWYMKDGGAGERYVELYANGDLTYVEINGGGLITSITKTGLTVGRHKCAIAYATNDFVFYVDGIQIGTHTSGTPSGFSTFGLQYYLSVYTGQQKVNQAAIFPTRLTNAQLASLTTL